jgi:hypothetical protein
MFMCLESMTDPKACDHDFLPPMMEQQKCHICINSFTTDNLLPYIWVHSSCQADIRVQRRETWTSLPRTHMSNLYIQWLFLAPTSETTMLGRLVWPDTEQKKTDFLTSLYSTYYRISVMTGWSGVCTHDDFATHLRSVCLRRINSLNVTTVRKEELYTWHWVLQHKSY